MNFKNVCDFLKKLHDLEKIVDSKKVCEFEKSLWFKKSLWIWIKFMILKKDELKKILNLKKFSEIWFFYEFENISCGQKVHEFNKTSWKFVFKEFKYLKEVHKFRTKLTNLKEARKFWES